MDLGPILLFYVLIPCLKIICFCVHFMHMTKIDSSRKKQFFSSRLFFFMDTLVRWVVFFFKLLTLRESSVGWLEIELLHYFINQLVILIVQVYTFSPLWICHEQKYQPFVRNNTDLYLGGGRDDGMAGGVGELEVNIGGSKRVRGTYDPLSAQFLSFSCIFWKIIGQIIGWCPPRSRRPRLRNPD